MGSRSVPLKTDTETVTNTTFKKVIMKVCLITVRCCPGKSLEHMNRSEKASKVNPTPVAESHIFSPTLKCCGIKSNSNIEMILKETDILARMCQKGLTPN